MGREGSGYRVWDVGYRVTGGNRVVGIFIGSNTLDARIGRRILMFSVLGVRVFGSGYRVVGIFTLSNTLDAGMGRRIKYYARRPQKCENRAQG